MLSPLEWTTLALSLKIAAAAVLLGLPGGIVFGYALARWSSPTKWVIETILSLPLVLPPVVTGYLLLMVLGRHGVLGGTLERVFGVRLVFTWQGAAIAAMVVSFPLMVRAIRLAFQSVDPRLEKAARTLGAGRMDVFLTVSLPLAWRGVLAGSVLAFARSLGEFGATIMIAGNIPGVTQTISLAVFSNVQRPGGMEASWRLVFVSVALAAAALAASEWLERRGSRHG